MLVVAIEIIAVGSVSQLRKPTSTMNEMSQKPISTPASGSRVK